MEYQGTLIIYFFWIVIFALVGAAIGASRGRALAGFFFGFLIGPIGWILIAVGPNYKAEARRKLRDEEEKSQSNIDQLAKLGALREKGLITEAEWELKKKQLLGATTSDGSSIKYRSGPP